MRGVTRVRTSKKVRMMRRGRWLRRLNRVKQVWRVIWMSRMRRI